MKVLYRPHRGTFADSMDLKEPFSSVDDLLKKYGPNLRISWYCFDKRLSAETFIVEEKWGPIGFCWFEEG
jgi:hypothetical protein